MAGAVCEGEIKYGNCSLEGYAQKLEKGTLEL